MTYKVGLGGVRVWVPSGKSVWDGAFVVFFLPAMDFLVDLPPGPAFFIFSIRQGGLGRQRDRR